MRQDGVVSVSTEWKLKEFSFAVRLVSFFYRTTLKNNQSHAVSNADERRDGEDCVNGKTWGRTDGRSNECLYCRGRRVRTRNTGGEEKEEGSVEYTLFKLVVSQHSTHERRGCRPNRPPPPMHESECALVVRVAEHVQRRRHADSSCCWARLRAASRECSFHTTAPIHTFDKARGCRQRMQCARVPSCRNLALRAEKVVCKRGVVCTKETNTTRCVLHPTTGWIGFRATTCRVMAGSRCH